MPIARRLALSLALALAAAAATGCRADPAAPEAAPADVLAPDAAPFTATEVATFAQPWAMAFLPDGRLLVTEKAGTLKLHAIGGATVEVAGVPEVAFGGQGGLGDVVPHPGFAENGLVYLSYAEADPADDDLRGAAIARGRLVEDAAGARLEGVEVIWRQLPKMTGRGHYGHRMLFDAEGALWVSSGDRQHFDPAQDMASNMGKVLRLTDAGQPMPDNPFAADGGVAAEVWSLGHRNPLGFAFAPGGALWVLEHGPAGGDELNLVRRGANYGWPVVSDGDHYDGRAIPDHATRPEFQTAAATWTPVIAPGAIAFYRGSAFPGWDGQLLAAGLASQALVRIAVEGETAREVARYPMGMRLRALAQAPDGTLWLLEDAPEGALLRVEPRG